MEIVKADISGIGREIAPYLKNIAERLYNESEYRIVIRVIEV
jgi:hypothetical protein